MLDTIALILYLLVLIPLTLFAVVGAFYMIIVTIGDIIRGD